MGVLLSLTRVQETHPSSSELSQLQTNLKLVVQSISGTKK